MSDNNSINDSDTITGQWKLFVIRNASGVPKETLARLQAAFFFGAAAGALIGAKNSVAAGREYANMMDRNIS